MDLADKIVIVTGAGGNLGSASAREIARQGGKVVLSDLAVANPEAIAAQIRAESGVAVAHEGDISNEADVIAMVETASREFGGLDALVNVAARIREGAKERTLEGLSAQQWDEVMAINLRGPMLASKHAVPLMLARGGGSIINFSSTAALLGDMGLLAYSTTKAGILGFTRAVATTYGKQGIRCNALCPGSVWKDEWKASMGEEMLDLMERTRMTPRLGVPQDIANMVVFLASDKSSYVTGQTFVVDGGGTAHQPWVGVQ